MLLRPRQKSFVERSLSALNEFGNSLGVAPTGAGKTILFSEIISRLIAEEGLKALVLAHRDELTSQNQEKFRLVNPSVSTSVYDATVKSWSGQVTFAMVPTLAREDNLRNMPAVDLLVIDEAHHAVADTYLRIVEKVRSLNPECWIFGVTATPNRGDRRGLRDVFSNVSDQISVGELINSGHLVPPRTFIMDVGVDRSRLLAIPKQAGEFNMVAVDRILNQEPINEAVVEQWKDKAEGRQTVVFCSTVAHAEAVTDAFLDGGVSTVLVKGELGSHQRDERLEQYASGNAKVIVNVAVLTEGWDHPPTSCVILLRQSSAKSTMIQMVGRGLRTVNTEDYPGVIKTDCIVLDFGASSIIHGSLEQDLDLEGALKEDVMLTMSCPSCEAEIPLSSSECPICGHEFDIDRLGQKRPKDVVTSVDMMEINLLGRSHFEWVDLYGDDASCISSGFEAWGGVFLLGENWHAIGGSKDRSPRVLTRGSRVVCLAAADDWLNEHETEETAYKSRRWLQEPPTPKQISALPPESRLDFNLTRYQASARITFERHREDIKTLVETG